MYAYNILDAFRHVINNHELGDVITRTEFIIACSRLDHPITKTYIDNTRRRLTVCDFLEYTGTPGRYIVRKHIPIEMTIPELEKLTEEMYESHVDTYINNSKSQTEYLLKIQNEKNSI